MGTFGVITQSVIPLREEDCHKSQMVSQLLFGEAVEVLQVREEWLYVKNIADGYLGWIEQKQFTFLEKAEFDQWVGMKKSVVALPIATIERKNDQTPMMIPAGSDIAGDNSFTIGNNSFLHNFSFSSSRAISEIALQFMNVPYLWGGKTVFGFDCSGFVQTVFKIAGIALPRDAFQQAELGKVVDFLQEVQPGDLAFFHNAEERITHVGIILSPTKIIHCSGSVRIDNIDHQGIFNVSLGKYTHPLRVVKRIKS